jgi:hypothetical protein
MRISRWAFPAVVTCLGALALPGCTRDGSTVAQPPLAPEPPLPVMHATLGTGLPPWRGPLNVLGGADAAGLRSGPEQGAARRFHSHLDIFINGKRTKVAPKLGIDGKYISELHTRDSTGTLEIDPSDASRRYVLGQLFIEWDVSLGPTYIGGLTAHPIVAYVNGAKVSGDPAEIELRPHEEIALIYGAPPPEIPKSYAFPSGT